MRRLSRSWTAASAETETPTPSMFTRMSRVMSTDQEKRKLKKHVRKSVGRNGSSENRNIQVIAASFNRFLGQDVIISTLGADKSFFRP